MCVCIKLIGLLCEKDYIRSIISSGRIHIFLSVRWETSAYIWFITLLFDYISSSYCMLLLFMYKLLVLINPIIRLNSHSWVFTYFFVL